MALDMLRRVARTGEGRTVGRRALSVLSCDCRSPHDHAEVLAILEGPAGPSPPTPRSWRTNPPLTAKQDVGKLQQDQELNRRDCPAAEC